MLKLVLIALEILKRIQQSRGTIKVSLTYQSQCSGITYQDALSTERNIVQKKPNCPLTLMRYITDLRFKIPGTGV